MEENGNHEAIKSETQQEKSQQPGVNEYNPEDYVKVKYIAPFIVLVTALIVCIIDIYHKNDLLTSMWHILIVVIVFSILGWSLQKYIFYTIAQVYLKKEEPEAEESEEQLNNEKNEDNQDEEMIENS